MTGAEIEEELRDAFHVVDKKGRGFIGTDELRRVMRDLGENTPDNGDNDEQINYEGRFTYSKLVYNL